jgi:NAD(P)-dependent dehydrogenase (short-subunit alcohol dehydrogenase family)
VEWAPAVRVNLVVGGLVLTEQANLHYGDEASQARVAATVPAGRLATPTDLADACLYLASPLPAAERARRRTCPPPNVPAAQPVADVGSQTGGTPQVRPRGR